MRVSESIRLVRGDRRFAVYDLTKGICEPVSIMEARILSILSKGVQVTPKSSGCPSKQVWAILSAMRRKSWLKRGSPKRVTLDLLIERDLIEIKPKRLTRVWIETTLSCNLRCKHCYASSGPEVDRKSELVLDKWEHIFHDLLKYGVDNVTFIGGEPTIRKDVIVLGSELMARYSPDTNVGVFSNLYSFGGSEEDIRFLQHHNLKVSTSLYGMHAADHDFVTARKGSWDKTVAAIRYLLNHNIDVFVGYFMTSSDDSKSTVAAWLRELGVTCYDIQSHENVGRALEVMVRPQRTANCLPDKIHFNPGTLQKYSQRHNCFSDHLAITPQGEVLGCIMMRDPVLGVLPDNTIEEVVSGHRFAGLAKLTKEAINGCSVCEYRYACFDCRPAAISDTGNLQEKPDCGYDPRLPLDIEA